MPKTILDYSAPDAPAVRRYTVGLWLGRVSLFFVLTLPLGAVIWILAIPWFAAAFGFALAALWMTKGKSRCAWVTVAIMSVYFILMVGAIIWSIIAPRS